MSTPAEKQRESLILEISVENWKASGNTIKKLDRPTYHDFLKDRERHFWKTPSESQSEKTKKQMAQAEVRAEQIREMVNPREKKSEHRRKQSEAMKAKYESGDYKGKWGRPKKDSK